MPAGDGADLVFSPTRSPRLRFGGGLSSLLSMTDKMNKTVAELKEGHFDTVKGHEAVQSLQTKLMRLQDHFDDNIGEVQQNIVEHAAFYATNPQVLGGMVKLTEVLGLASVLLAQKADAIQELLETYLAPLEQQFKLSRQKWDNLEEEVKVYRTQVNQALERGNKYETEVTMHLKNAKESMRKKLVEEVERKVSDVTNRNHELQRQVKQLEFQLKRQASAKAMSSSGGVRSTVITAAHGSGPPDSAALRNIEMVEKVNELEFLLEHEKGEMLTPMIKDACNYLRTLLAMKDDDQPPAAAGGAAASSSSSRPRGNSNRPLFYSEAPDSDAIPAVNLHTSGEGGTIKRNITNYMHTASASSQPHPSSSSSSSQPQYPSVAGTVLHNYPSSATSAAGAPTTSAQQRPSFTSQTDASQQAAGAGLQSPTSSLYSHQSSLRVGGQSGDYHRALGIVKPPDGGQQPGAEQSENESVFSAPRLG
ncbi:unnamed protein product [Amoebophrya sp. A120]|nr:unnamed protein product [Amoebophrya sp. A120]|eukprot:GSA120T00002093001.1